MRPPAICDDDSRSMASSILLVQFFHPFLDAYASESPFEQPLAAVEAAIPEHVSSAADDDEAVAGSRTLA